MAAFRLVRVTPGQPANWRVVEDNHIASVHTTRKAALTAAKTIAAKKGAELIVYSRNGHVLPAYSSSLVRRVVLESPGTPSVPRAKIAAAARFAFSGDVHQAKTSSSTTGHVETKRSKRRTGSGDEAR